MIAMARDTAAMTAAERLAEITEILATGYLRLRAARVSAEKGLDVSAGSEAHSDSNALNPKSGEPAA